jgi:LacI family transcriptional regulator
MLTTPEKKITLRDIANLSNVSVTAVSMALSNSSEVSEETKRKIQLISRKMGYIPKRSLRVQEANLTRPKMPSRIGFLYIGMNLNDEVLASTLHNLVILSSELGVRVEVNAIETTSDSQSVMEKTLAYIKNLDALLISGLIDKSLLNKIEKDGIPYVIIGRTLLKNNESYSGTGLRIGPDDLGMGKLATSHLFACGHRRIAFICEIIYKGLSNAHWLEGYRYAHFDADIPLDTSLIHVTGKELVDGEPAAQAMLALKKLPDAYVIPDVRTAASFVNAMQKRGISISRESIIIGGKINVAQRYHLEAYPLLCVDDMHLVRASLDYLFQTFEKPKPYLSEIVVPITTHNLPKLPENAI